MATGTVESGRTLRISCSAMPSLGGEPALEPVRIEGDEGLSRLFRYTLTLTTPEQSGYSWWARS